METPGLLLVGLVVAIGLVGIVVPILPGLVLVCAAIGCWALVEREPLAWLVLAFAVLVSVAAQVAKYLIPGKRMTLAGVPTRTIVAGGVLGVVGFFVLPVLGLPLGFVLGIYLAQRARTEDHRAAWAATVVAVKAVVLSVAIELTAGAAAAGAWLAAVLI